jgi:hypothetical protein
MKQKEIRKIKFGNWPLPEEVCTELGRMHAIWSTLESALSLYIGKLSGFNDHNDMRPYILLNNTSFQQKLEILSSLCDYLAKQYPSLSKYPDVISKLKTAQKLRNTFTHQHIVFNPESEELELATGSSRGKLKTNVRKFNVEEIKRAIMDIDEANVALYELVLEKKIKPVWKKIVDGEKKV